MSTGAKATAQLFAQVKYLRSRLHSLEQRLADSVPDADGGVAVDHGGAIPTAIDVAAHLAEIIQHVTFPVSILDRESRFLFCNQATAALFQVSAEELTGSLLRDTLQDARIDAYEARIRGAIDQGVTQTFQDEIVFPSGRRWLASVHERVRLPGTDLFGDLIVAIDISDQKTVEASLVERVQFEELIANISSDFATATDADIGPKTERSLAALGRFMQVDRVLVFELSPCQQQLNAIHEWAAPGVERALDRLQGQSRAQFQWIFTQIAAGETHAISRLSELPPEAAAERRILERVGVRSLIWVPLQFGGQVIGTLCLDSLREEREWSEQIVSRLRVVANMIATSRVRVRAERELAESRAFIDGVTAASPLICFIFDLDTHQTHHLNRRVEAILGYSVEELVQMGDSYIPRMLHPEDIEVMPANLERWHAIADHEVLECSYRLRRRDGDWRWIRSWLKVFRRGADGRVSQIIGWAEDHTDRKRAWEQAQRHRDELARVNRVKTLGEMVTGVAHELSQPLYAITNFVNAVHNVLEKRDDPQIREVLEWLEQASNAAGNAGRIIQRLRTFARGGQQLRAFETVANLVDGAIAIMQFEAQRRETQIVVQLERGQTQLLVDRVQIQQVLVNLIQNACEAMETCSPDQREIQLQTRLVGGQVEFTVRDRGVGLPAIALFDPFVTTKPDGLGLGLAISHTIVEEHGGELRAEANAEQGATFRFTIPLPENPTHD